MPRSIHEEAASAVWQALLELRRLTKSSPPKELELVAVVRDADSGWRLSAGDVTGCEEVLWVPLAGSVPSTAVEAPGVAYYDHDRFLAGEDPIVPLRGALGADALSVLRMYLPCLVGGYRARSTGGVFVLAHLAQTLDGRIACSNGHSRWISNEANLVHSHRLRALHDAVLVGGRTVAFDDPQLTVRHVEGDDPERIILSATASVLRSEADYHVFGGAGCTVLCGTSAAASLSLNGRHDKVELVPVSCADEALITSKGVCDALAARGISSVFVEGGGRTLSCFLADAALDVLHVHFAPVVLGSGISGFQLPEVETIQAGHRLLVEQFSLDGEVLLECRERSAE